MNQFKPNLIRAALISSGMALATGSAVAQEVASDSADNVEVIQVSGIRGALQRAQAIKMENTSIVEALSAEDIGKLPDTSIAESLARLPGLAGERRNGRTSGLSVRGFNENYIGTTLNGRELLGMGDNRGVEFDLYPTEIVSNILVYKTSEAGLMVQGVGGTVDLQTVEPLSAEATLTVNGNYEINEESALNPDFDDNGHRVSVNFVDQFMDDTLGLAVSIASQETPRQEEQFRGWGYDSQNDGEYVRLSGHDSFARSAMLERDSIAAVLQYAPNDKLNVQFDALYIDFVEEDARRGLEEGLFGGVADEVITNGLATGFTSTGFESVIRNDSRRQEAELTTFGLNVEYALNDYWMVEVDVARSEVDKTITDVESYSGVGRAGTAGRPTSARTYQNAANGAFFSPHPTLPFVDLTDPSLVRLAGPQGWGGGLRPVEAFGDNFFNAQDGFVNRPDFDEELTTARFEVKHFMDHDVFSQLTLGLNYSDRSKTKINNGDFLTSPEFPGDGAIPADFLLGSVSLDFIGINGVIAYDGLGLYESGYYDRNDAARYETGRFGDTYTVEEELLTAYAKLDIETEVGDMLLRGNLGLQVIDVDQSSTGFASTFGAGGIVAATPVEMGDSYTDVLPTLNLSLEVAEDQYVRVAASKVLSRPRIDDMRSSSFVSFQFNDFNIESDELNNSPWSSSQGNPMLKPLEANQFDVSYENYFSDEGYFALSFFYKDLTNWHREVAEVGDFTNDFIADYHLSTQGLPPVLFQGSASSREDGLTGEVTGWEIQGNLPLNILHDSLDGFGIYASATFIDGSLDVAAGDDDRVPGLSEENYALTVFYEYQGFEVRFSGTKRDSFLTEQRGLSLALDNATDQGFEIWDAQVSYDFSESNIDALHGLRVTLQAQNINDEPTVLSNQGDSRQVLRHSRFGANYILGFNYSF